MTYDFHSELQPDWQECVTDIKSAPIVDLDILNSVLKLEASDVTRG
jgi:hypothetical protein